ncbi:MAG: ParB/RepB/Spo0J family partition protein [Oscillospiraceae bacterium]|jgi:ParB family chromosome partitioning protein|nr:ParB/RepB/Spo0J family partition protein [Oscillospiraceae bacterium]
MISKRSNLGKGLSTIFRENDTQEKGKVLILDVSEISSNKNQPRKNFNIESLAELADSISKHGVLQPLVVRSLGGIDGYQIIAGERRWRASKILGLKKIPAIVLEISDDKAIELALVENLQREDLTPIEEARGYKLLIENYKFTQEIVSKEVGKSRSVVANAIRLLNLPNEVLLAVEEDRLTPGHARTLLSLKNKEKIKQIAKIAEKRNLSIRELERLCKKENEQIKIKSNTSSNDFHDSESFLTEHLQRKVKLTTTKNGNGIIRIHFKDKKDLLKILKLFKPSC